MATDRFPGTRSCNRWEWVPLVLSGRSPLFHGWISILPSRKRKTWHYTLSKRLRKINTMGQFTVPQEINWPERPSPSRKLWSLSAHPSCPREHIANWSSWNICAMRTCVGPESGDSHYYAQYWRQTRLSAWATFSFPRSRICTCADYCPQTNPTNRILPESAVADFHRYSYFVTELLGTDLHRLLTSRPLEKQFIQYFLYQILVCRLLR